MISECDKCNGQGVVEKDGKLYDCICSYLKRVSFNMPPYIRRSPVEKKHLELPIINAIGKSLYIIGYWSDMKSVVKAMYIKYPDKIIRITSDAEIRDVFVGSKSKAAKTSDFIGDIYNNISDLMDTPNLCVVKLNEITYKNKAAAGALEEALLYRLDRDKPTWVFCNLERKFNTASYAYSESVSNLITQNYARFTIPEINKPQTLEEMEENPVQFSAITYDDVVVDSPKKKEKIKTKKPKLEELVEIEPEEEEQLEEEEDTISLSDRYGAGIKASKGSFNRGFGKGRK